MTPAPYLHQNEEDDHDGDIGRKEHITAPEEHPLLQAKTQLRQKGSDEIQKGHPESPSNRDPELSRHIYSFAKAIIISFITSS